MPRVRPGATRQTGGEMGFASRQPTPNEDESATWNYGPQFPHDDFSALLNEDAKRCPQCKRVTMKRFLIDGWCPECRRTGPEN